MLNHKNTNTVSEIDTYVLQMRGNIRLWGWLHCFSSALLNQLDWRYEYLQHLAASWLNQQVKHNLHNNTLLRLYIPK